MWEAPYLKSIEQISQLSLHNLFSVVYSALSKAVCTQVCKICVSLESIESIVSTHCLVGELSTIYRSLWNCLLIFQLLC